MEDFKFQGKNCRKKNKTKQNNAGLGNMGLAWALSKKIMNTPTHVSFFKRKK
jgi:hypothetical protein